MSSNLSSIARPLRLGPVTLPNALGLAPMAGFSDLPYRRICRALGAGLVVTELSSARALRHGAKAEKQYRYLSIEGLPHPAAIQLFGAEVEDFTAALDWIFADPRTRAVGVIDLNMGCPVPKVVKTGAGAALLLDPARAAAIVRAVKARCAPLGKACTVKTRIGFHAGENIAAEFCLRLAEAGADGICLHGRTRSQMYAGTADWAALAEAKRALGAAAEGAPVFWANGDVRCAEDAAALIAATRADGLMVGRAALGRPWIFPEILYLAEHGRPRPAPSLSERAELGRRHCAETLDWLGEEAACRELRKTLAAYTRGLRGGAALRRQAVTVAGAADIEAFWRAFEGGAEPGGALSAPRA